MIIARDIFLFIFCGYLAYKEQYNLSAGLLAFSVFLNSRFDKLKIDAATKTLEIDDDKPTP